MVPAPARQAEKTPVFCKTPCVPTKSYDGTAFPLLLSPPSNEPALLTDAKAVTAYLEKNRDHIMSLLKIHSVLYFRNFACQTSTAVDFANYVTQGLGLKPFPYALGNAVRTSIVDDIVFTANEAPPERLIPFHHELAQTPKYPTYILFYCDKPAETGGETPICHSGAVYNALQERFPEFLDQVEKHGVVYSRTMTRHDRSESAIGRGWASTFGADARADVEEVLKARGYSWKWDSDAEDSNLTEISPVLPAVVKTGGRKAFFNQMFAAWFGWSDEFNTPSECIRAGNGDTLDPEAMDGLKAILEENEVAIPWEKGDFMFIDNMQAMHSRRTFSGRRRVLASLAD